MAVAAEHMKDDLPDEVEYRLDRWGRMARGRYDMADGGSLNILSRLIEEGPTAAAQSTDWASDHLPDDVLETDQAVARLPIRYQQAVRVHYMQGRNWPTSAKCKMIHTSRANFFLYLNAAKVAIYMTLMARI